MNEAETRAEHIDPTLKAAGWGVVEPSPPELAYHPMNGDRFVVKRTSTPGGRELGPAAAPGSFYLAMTTAGSGGLELSIQELEAGWRDVLEGPMDLEGWAMVLARTSAGGIQVFTNTKMTDHPARFYRVIVRCGAEGWSRSRRVRSSFFRKSTFR